MTTRYNFELMLEKIAEEFYFNAASALVATRGGNSRGNEVYFGNVAPSLKRGLRCQQLILAKGSCPDSGIFGNFGYRHRDEVNWDLVRSGEIVALEVPIANNQKQYIEVNVASLTLPDFISEVERINLRLNDFVENEDFFGVEFKATVNGGQNSIQVASFNSTCPSNTKTATLTKIQMIHNLPTRMKRKFENDPILKKCFIDLRVQFNMYYFIVNDIEIETRSEIKQILLCRGSFFAPNTTEERAAELSSQIMPRDLGLELDLYRVNLRYRPFFESRVIQSNGYGIYTSWESRMIGEIAEEAQRMTLLNEVERIQQDLIPDENNQAGQVEEEDNVIYLNLREERIRRRAA